jgi:two-component system OmpR family response regulator
VAHILIADDDSHIREVVRFALERDGHRITEAADGSEALSACEGDAPDLVILDIMMPEQDGLEVCRQLRVRSVLPILFLSSRDEELDRILGLEMGADDYVTKPFSPRELAARVKAMLRRVNGHFAAQSAAGQGGEGVLCFGALTLDPVRHECRWHDEAIFLTATEFMLLRSLLAAPQKVYTREELVERAYGHGHHITERTVDSHVRRIRKKFAALGVDSIETVHGVGYRMRAEASHA